MEISVATPLCNVLFQKTYLVLECKNASSRLLFTEHSSQITEYRTVSRNIPLASSLNQAMRN